MWAKYLVSLERNVEISVIRPHQSLAIYVLVCGINIYVNTSCCVCLFVSLVN